MEIYRFSLISQINKNSFLFEIKCSSGTYIRSIARDLGIALDSCAFMSALIRTESGEFNILNSTCVLDLTKTNVFDKLIKLEFLLKTLKRVNVDTKLEKQISNGVKLLINQEDQDDIVVYCNNKLVGIGKIENKTLSIKTNLQN